MGLCPVAAQPGPHATATVDPSARLFITFNEPIMKGPCFDEEAADCVVTLKPVLHGKREYVLSEVESELMFAGETLALRPPFQLAPFTNYTVTLGPRVVHPYQDFTNYTATLGQLYDSSLFVTTFNKKTKTALKNSFLAIFYSTHTMGPGTAGLLLFRLS